jgi:hypothetical protein
MLSAYRHGLFHRIIYKKWIMSWFIWITYNNTQLCVNTCLHLSQAPSSSVLFRWGLKSTDCYCRIYWVIPFFLEVDLSWKPFTSVTYFRLQIQASKMVAEDNRRRSVVLFTIPKKNRWPLVLISCRIQRDRPAQWDGWQRLLPGEGLETHTATVFGSFVEETANCQTE